MPLIPDCTVPSQYASTSCLVTPADPNASAVAASSSSSTPLSQCSANRVQPMPPMATPSLIPCGPTSAVPLCVPFRAVRVPHPTGLPEIITDAVRPEQP